MRHLSRPRLLVRAARYAADDYSRSRDLKRILRGPVPLRPASALHKLVEQEQMLHEAKTIQHASYSAIRHVETLAALIGEHRLYAATHSQPQPSRPSLSLV
ncbi:hypothetical protein FPZ52_04375 [Qingshengfaniella alkalisoli]|uniref:Uncharacterized protein n=1 Tax=Qingshengfaniella alkalisoli TaxID=2599296 RepID=A0A5B8I8D4_9RHOB|nr:hypothetical protein FPZ52_04375 [Qingshengfaniella alkalisoli]